MFACLLIKNIGNFDRFVSKCVTLSLKIVMRANFSCDLRSAVHTQRALVSFTPVGKCRSFSTQLHNYRPPNLAMWVVASGVTHDE